MRRYPIVPALAVAAALVGGTAHAFGWADLWLTHDQRAERLLRRGDAAAAARLFHDPRRRAYAESAARHYAAAASQLQRFTDPLSEYDRGNALARAGRLSEAIGAYTASLRTAPHGSGLYRDARHNRAIVEQQIKAQQRRKPSQPPPGGNGKPSQPSQPGQQGPQGRQGQQGQQGQQGSKGQQGPSGQPAHPDQPGQSASAVGRGAAPGQGSSPTSVGAAPASAASAASAAARARHDAEFALGRAPHGAGGTRSPPRPQSERNLSLDQWLRWIPDNPGGLLRRKFMIEHLLQQEREGSRP